MTNSKNDRRGWHLDKNVNIPVLVALMMNFSALIWGASKLDSRVDVNAKDNLRTQSALTTYMDEQKKTNKELTDNISNLSGQVIAIGTKMDILLNQRGGDK